MHGVTRDLVLEAVVQGVDTDPWGNERFGLEAVGTLKRRLRHALRPGARSGNKLVGDKVEHPAGHLRRQAGMTARAPHD